MTEAEIFANVIELARGIEQLSCPEAERNEAEAKVTKAVAVLLGNLLVDINRIANGVDACAVALNEVVVQLNSIAVVQMSKRA
jgi:hypothetical protein